MELHDPALAATAPPGVRPTRARYIVLAFLCVLSFVLYIDRVCIGRAVKPIEEELDLNETEMGLVIGAFTLAYGLFEVPTGWWGDRYGSRGVLTRIVLWWSAFTALTGASISLAMLLVVRFLFGAGEAGALPNAGRVVARWFPPLARGRAQGAVITSTQIGGAVAPVIAGYVIAWVGWRWAFAVFGTLGVAWAAAFYWWFRDDPAEHPAANAAERDLIAGPDPCPRRPEEHPPLPWRRILTNRNVWLLGGTMTCGAAAAYVYLFWLPHYLEVARGVAPEVAGWLAGLVLAGGALGGVSGGFMHDWLFRLRDGERRWTRRMLGAPAFALAAGAVFLSVQYDSPVVAALFLALACYSVQAQLAAWFGVVTDISGPHLGALFGLMNSMGVPGAIASPIFVGWVADERKAMGVSGRAQWDPAFYAITVILLVGAVCWLFADPYQPIADPSDGPGGADAPEVETSAPGAGDQIVQAVDRSHPS